MISQVEALEQALIDSDLAEKHPAAVELARKLARNVDAFPDGADAKELAPLGRLYLDTLGTLGLTPAKSAKGGADVREHPGNPLQAARDAARARRAATVDASAS